MLGLLTPTDPCWVQAAAGDLDGLLRDHAHCELKAAQTALSLIGRWGGQEPAWIEPLLELAREETEHFRDVQGRLSERGARMSPPRPDEYVVALRAAARGDGSDTPALLDRLLVSSLIEARSCERFQLLAERLPDAELRGFYRGLMASEARHHRLFARLAEAKFGEQTARARLTELAGREAAVASKLPLGPTVHG